MIISSSLLNLSLQILISTSPVVGVANVLEKYSEHEFPEHRVDPFPRTDRQS